MLSPESVLAIPLPALEGGFGFTPWETAAQFSPPSQRRQPQPQNPVQAPAQTQTTHAATPRSSGSDESGRDRPVSPAEERRLRRMISNRESARRSRMRKQRHLEDLRCQVDRLKSQNRELGDQLVAVTGRCLLFCRDNDRLRSEAAALRRRLLDAIFWQRLATAAPLPHPPPPPPPQPPAAPQDLLAPPIYGGGFMTGTELIA